MELTQRQEKILDCLIKDYINRADPVSSKLLKKSANLDICEATIRNEFQELTDRGYISQPHTSAGRIPTEKAYRYFVDKMMTRREELISEFIFKEAESVRKQIENELRLAEELTRSLSQMSSTLTIKYTLEKDDLFDILNILGSKTSHEKNMNLINNLIKELENF